MVIRLGYAFGMIAAAMVAVRERVTVAAETAAWAFGNFLAAAFALFRPEPPLFTGEGYADYAGRGSPLDPALRNGLRHEAHMRTRAAHRHV